MDPKDSLEDILSDLKAEYRPECTSQDPLKGNSSSIHHELLIPNQLDDLQPDVAYRDPGLNALLKEIKNDPRDLTLGHSKNQNHLPALIENHGYQDLLHKELFDHPKDKIKSPSGDQKVRVPQSPTSSDPNLKALLQDLTTEEPSAKHLLQSATPALPSDPNLKALLQDLTIQESLPPKNPPRRQDPLEQEKKSGPSGFMVTAPEVPNINPGHGKDLRALNAATPPRFQESQKRSHQPPETNLFPAQENVNSTSDKPYQDDIQQKRIWIKKAQSWLKSLNPDSFDAEWFEVYAQSYPSRLEAAISYLQGIAELEGNHG